MNNEKIIDIVSRLDIVTSSLFDISRSQASKAIKNGFVLINNTVIKTPSYKTKIGDSIIYNEIISNTNSVLPMKEKIDIEYVYKDEDIVVINKPRGLVVHPSAGHYDDTLVNYLFTNEESYDFIESTSNRPGIVHRIDKDTSGLIVVALNSNAQAFLSNEVKEHKVERKYFALVYGNVKDKYFQVNAPLTRPNHTIRKAVVDVYNGRESITHFQTLANNGKVSFLKCTLETGRTHQIRAHLAYIGYPIIGDKLYCQRKEDIASSGQALHAYSLTLTHPKTKKRMTFYAPLDDYMKKLLIHYYSNKKR